MNDDNNDPVPSNYDFGDYQKRLTVDETEQYLKEFYEMWIPPHKDPLTANYRNYEFSVFSDLSIDTIDRKYDKMSSDAFYISQNAIILGIDKDPHTSCCIRKIQESIYYAHESVKNLCREAMNYDPTYDSMISNEIDLTRYMHIDHSKNNGYHAAYYSK